MEPIKRQVSLTDKEVAEVMTRFEKNQKTAYRKQLISDVVKQVSGWGFVLLLLIGLPLLIFSLGLPEFVAMLLYSSMTLLILYLVQKKWVRKKKESSPLKEFEKELKQLFKK